MKLKNNHVVKVPAIVVEGNYATIIAQYFADVHGRGKENVGFKLLSASTYRRMLNVLPARKDPQKCAELKNIF